MPWCFLLLFFTHRPKLCFLKKTKVFCFCSFVCFSFSSHHLLGTQNFYSMQKSIFQLQRVWKTNMNSFIYSFFNNYLSRFAMLQTWLLKLERQWWKKSAKPLPLSFRYSSTKVNKYEQTNNLIHITNSAKSYAEKVRTICWWKNTKYYRNASILGEIISSELYCWGNDIWMKERRVGLNYKQWLPRSWGRKSRAD